MVFRFGGGGEQIWTDCAQSEVSVLLRVYMKNPKCFAEVLSLMFLEPDIAYSQLPSSNTCLLQAKICYVFWAIRRMREAHESDSVARQSGKHEPVRLDMDES